MELGYTFEMPDPRAERLVYSQGFVGIDGGRVESLGNALSAGGTDNWASLSVGLRSLRGNFLGEIAASRILERLQTPFHFEGRDLYVSSSIGIAFR